MMAYTHLIHQALLKDSIIWEETSNGMFLIKLAYELTQKDSCEVCNAKWRAVWRLVVPERVRVFKW